jgi:hypothetical protein
MRSLPIVIQTSRFYHSIFQPSLPITHTTLSGSSLPEFKPLQRSNIIQVLLFYLFATAIEAVHPNIFASRLMAAHSHSLSARLVRLQEFAESFLANFKCLCGGCVGHSSDGTPKVQGKSDVGADTAEDEEDEIDWVAQNCVMLVNVQIYTNSDRLTSYYLVPTQRQ